MMTEEAKIVGSFFLGQHAKTTIFRRALNQQKHKLKAHKGKRKHAPDFSDNVPAIITDESNLEHGGS